MARETCPNLLDGQWDGVDLEPPVSKGCWKHLEWTWFSEKLLTQHKTKNNKNKIEHFKLLSKFSFVHPLRKKENHLTFKLSMPCLVPIYLTYLKFKWYHYGAFKFGKTDMFSRPEMKSRKWGGWPFIAKMIIPPVSFLGVFIIKQVLILEEQWERK